MTREEMERLWNEPGILNLEHPTGAKPSPGREALAFRAKVIGGKGWPAWVKNYDKDKLYPSAELVARYKADCPNNWRALVAAFGKTETKYDDPRQFGV